MLCTRIVLCLVLVLLGERAIAVEVAAGGLTLTPGEIVLHGHAARQRPLVTRSENGRSSDVTRKAVFPSDTPAVARVTADGIVMPVADGTTIITATLGGRQARATGKVVDGARLAPVTFERDVVPILTRAGCNAGACHG